MDKTKKGNKLLADENTDKDVANVVRIMKTSWNGNIFRVTEGNPLMTGGFSLQKPVTQSFIFFMCAWIKTVDHTIETPMFSDTMALIITTLE